MATERALKLPSTLPSPVRCTPVVAWPLAPLGAISVPQAFASRSSSSKRALALGTSSVRSGRRSATRAKPLAIWLEVICPDAPSRANRSMTAAAALPSRSSATTSAVLTASCMKCGAPSSSRPRDTSSKSLLSRYSCTASAMARLARVSSLSPPPQCAYTSATELSSLASEPWRRRRLVACTSTSSYGARSPSGRAAPLVLRKSMGRMSSATARATKTESSVLALGTSSSRSATVSSSIRKPRSTCSVYSPSPDSAHSSTATSSRSRARWSSEVVMARLTKCCANDGMRSS
mmetsp:Transcript_13097/g.40890  ORF Transcript_13097/g.40890 Transcript_13097/m.40890 type:complete len:291 (-) Transcript_13097:955-1827(-)